jgi:hypothetical protein
MAEEFAPTACYHADGRVVLVTSAAQWAALDAQGGWADTPAAHGVITAPNEEQKQQLPTATPGPPTAVSTPAEHVAFSHLLQRWEHRMHLMNQDMLTFQDALATMHPSLTQALAALDALATRIGVLEQWVVQHTAPDAAPPVSADASRAERRR